MNIQHDLKEKELVEDPAIETLTEVLKWEEINPKDAEEMRGSKKEVFLYPILREQLKKLNDWISDENLEQAVRTLTKVPAGSVIEANERVFELLERGTTVRQDIGDGLGFKGRDVKFIDFEHPGNNVFHIVRQFRVEHHKENIPDLVLFINGIPIIVIECKSPTLGKPLEKGRKQVFRYQECKDEYRNLGCPPLFNSVQIVAILTGDQAKFGTTFTPWRHWSEWLDVYPHTEEEATRILGKTPNAMEKFLLGACRKENLLDLIQNFVVFERESGKTKKKIAKYMQFRAVNRTLSQVTGPERKGGIIWHWQGSGKSLTMLWIAVKLRRLRELRNPTILVVTDRIDLDNQIYATFEHCGFPQPIQARSSSHLKQLLTNPVGQTIMTTIQKFQDTIDAYPLLTEDPNIFVLADEAHESQYGWFAANMRKALPNGCFLGFTGTPIAKRNRNTFDTFGPYIDRYDHRQSMADGVTVPIKYLGRLPEMQVTSGTIDQVFDRVFAEFTPEEREAIKKKYVTQEAIATAPQRIRAVANDIISHFTTAIQPNDFKAQVVAVSRDAAIQYYRAIRELHGPSCEVLISTVHNDDITFAEFQKAKTEEQEIIRRFKEEQDPQILIVCDKLIKGFDAPVEQVMYLDKPLKEHTLLQAIGRVNRRMQNKEYGLVVDYWGLLTELNDALNMYEKTEVQGMIETDFIPQIINQAEAARRAAMGFFQSVEKTGNRRLDDEACVEYLEPEDRRIRFNQMFKTFAMLVDMLLPDPAALPFRADLEWLGNIRTRARHRYRDESFDLTDCSGKVRRLIADYLAVSDITALNEPVSIFSPQFDQMVEDLPTKKSKASEIIHALSHEITIKAHEDPVFYESLRERLDRIIQETRQKRLDEQKTLDELAGLLHEARNPRARAEKIGIAPELVPLYALIAKDIGEIDGLKDATQEVHDALVSHAVIGWEVKMDAQREMRKSIKEVLRSRSLSPPDIDGLVAKILDLAKGQANE